MNQFRVTACVRVDSRWFGRYAEMCAALFLPAHLFKTGFTGYSAFQY